jgi:hypothetical protein
LWIGRDARAPGSGVSQTPYRVVSRNVDSDNTWSLTVGMGTSSDDNSEGGNEAKWRDGRDALCRWDTPEKVSTQNMAKV